MNDAKFNAILVLIVPQVIHLIIEKYGVDEIVATREFYTSKVCATLTQEDTKVWHYSPLTIFNMYDEEVKTGDFEYPEGA